MLLTKVLFTASIIGCAVVSQQDYDDSQVDDYNSIYKNVQMLQPFGWRGSNLNVNSANSSTAVNVEVKLKSYINQGLRLPGGMTCSCPSGFQCAYLGTTEARCYMSFTIIVSSPGDSVRYMTTGFLPLAESGQLDLSRMTQNQSAIDIFVHHMGVVINAQNGELTQMQTVVHVDTFVQSLANVLPSIGQLGGNEQSVTLTGQLLGTQLSLSYAVQCAGSAIGQDCDLQCNTSSVNSAVAICRSVNTGFLFTCTYTGGNNQVQNCNACPWGVAEDSYCRDMNGGVLHPSSAQVVPPGFRTATIVLAVIAGTLFVLLMLVTVYSCLLVKRSMKEDEGAPGHNYHSSLRAEGNANRPLLQATYTAQSPAPSNDSFQQQPPPVQPRSIPNLDAVPGKSLLRKTNYIPPAHLGGTASVNDTLNSSITSVPMPPSREADV
uniref:LAM_G_DOMAIN domain-containing protein n=1 Tax=Ascaris lumbricoides TaxID=6252 RepID=A0A0M3I0F8_ASCLU